VRPEGEARWLCVNNDCPAQVMARLIQHVGKDAMDIDGLGEKQLARFRENGWIQSIPDIYRLPYDEILALEGFKEKSIENLRLAIDQAKEKSLQRLLVSLSIHHVGRKASKMLAEQLEDIRDLAEWPEERFLSIHGMGKTVADNVSAWFANSHNRNMIEQLAQLGVNTKQTEEDKPLAVDESAPFFGKTILFTGTLSEIGRKEAQALAEAAGARNVSGVSSKLDILVAGEKAGSKLKKAEALGTVKILSEADFLEMVR
jgi:DNA ligase (NAD+)